MYKKIQKDKHRSGKHKVVKMKGLLREISISGRITIPANYRKILKIQAGQGMIHQLNENIIKIKKCKDGREVNAEGRYSIPKEIRDYLDIRYGDRLDVWIEDDTICMKKEQPRCELCKTKHNILEVNGFWICKRCGNGIIKAMR